MRRGDVVRTVAEFNALPVGSKVAGIDGRVHPRDELGAAIIVGDDQRNWLPALVRVVGPVEPEWLEAAAIAAREAQPGTVLMETWQEKGETGKQHYRLMARAAVAAADKARGIVNSREEFDALPVGTLVYGIGRDGRWQARVGDTRFVPDEFPGYFRVAR